jgi:hypothetical protein
MTASLTAPRIAREVSNLRPDWRNPERYRENRHEIERALQRLPNQLKRTQ